MSLVFSYLSKVLFSSFLRFKGNFVDDQNNSKYRYVAPIITWLHSSNQFFSSWEMTWYFLTQTTIWSNCWLLRWFMPGFMPQACQNFVQICKIWATAVHVLCKYQMVFPGFLCITRFLPLLTTASQGGCWVPEAPRNLHYWQPAP